MTNFARSLYATTSSHVAMGIALAVLGATPGFAQDIAADASAAAAVVAQDPAVAQNPAEAQASAEDQDQAAADEMSKVQGEDIVVTGIRSSIRTSVNIKKNNSSIVEVVTAEEIGKLPDISIAESLSRLPGLATQRLDGRANVISIRGLAPDFTTTLLNGREQVSANNNRGVELDQYPSELLNGAVVYKTPDASLIGQALGGTIDMLTVRPLAYGKQAFVIGARGEINDLGEINPDISNKGYRANASYIDQNADGTIGWAIGIAHMKSPTAEKRYQAWGENGWPTTGAGEFVLGGAKPYVKSNELKRTGVMGVLEFQPNDQWHLTLDGYWSKFKDDQRLRGLELPLWWSDAVLQPGYTVDDNLVTEGTFANVGAVMRNDVVHRDSTIFAGGLNTEYSPNDRLTIEADVSYSRLKKTEENVEIYLGTGRGPLGVTDTIGFTVGKNGHFVFDPTLDYTDTTLFQLTDPRGWCGRPGFPGDCQDGFVNSPKIKDQLASLRLQATQDIGDNDSVTLGANYGHRKKSLDDEGFVLTHENYPASTPVPTDLLFDPVSLGFVGIPGIVAFDSWKYYKEGHYTLTPESTWEPSRKYRSYEVTEKVLTGYVQYNLDRDLGSVPVRGNVGVQVVHTDQSGDSFAATKVGGLTVVEPITDGDTYTEVLPSMNLTFVVSPNNFIRFSAARVLARARMDQLSPGNGFSYNPANAGQTDIEVSPWSGEAGNGKLRPLIADTVDLGFESYFAPSAYVSIVGYYKHLESYIYQQQTLFDFTGYPYTGPEPELFEGYVKQWTNAGGGKVYGIEASTSLPFNVLTSALDGFGALFSASYTKSSVRLGSDAPKTMLPNLSKWVVNSTLYFEKYGFQTRVSGRYRSKYLSEVAGLSLKRDPIMAKSEFLVDAQIGYEFQKGALKGLAITATGYNLTNEPFVTYVDNDTSHIRDYQDYGRNYMLGFSYKF